MQGVPNFSMLQVFVSKTCYSNYVGLSTVTSQRAWLKPNALQYLHLVIL